MRFRAALIRATRSVMFLKPQFFPMGDRALVVELGHRIDVDLSWEIAALARRLRACALPGVTDIVPAYTTLTLHYDPARHWRRTL